MGARRTTIWDDHHVVSGRWRPLHRLHVHRRARTSVRRRRYRLLRRTLHDHRLPDPVPGFPAPLECLSQARIHHRGRFRARPLRQSLARARNNDYRSCRDYAVHRSAARRHPGRGRRARHFRHRPDDGPAARHRVRGAGRFHVLERPQGSGVDCDRQGHPDLCDGLHCHHRHSDPARRLCEDLLSRARAKAAARRARCRFDRRL